MKANFNTIRVFALGQQGQSSPTLNQLLGSLSNYKLYHFEPETSMLRLLQFRPDYIVDGERVISTQDLRWN